MWSFSWPNALNALSHWLQWKGRSPVWILIWVFKFPFSLKDLSQKVHLKGRILYYRKIIYNIYTWVRRWASILFWCEYTLWQFENVHLNLFSKISFVFSFLISIENKSKVMYLWRYRKVLDCFSYSFYLLVKECCMLYL